MKKIAHHALRYILPSAIRGKIAARLELRHRRSELRNEHRIRQSPDRIVLISTILPGVRDMARDILWIGCRGYTREYPALLEEKGAQCWTLDIEPATAQFGHPERHIVGDLLRLEDHFAPGALDAVLCNGVLGWGVDSLQAQAAAIAQMARALRPGGLLLLGWNTNRMPDPASLLSSLFTPEDLFGLGKRMAVAGHTHVYDFLLRAAGTQVQGHP